MTNFKFKDESETLETNRLLILQTLRLKICHKSLTFPLLLFYYKTIGYVWNAYFEKLCALQPKCDHYLCIWIYKCDYCYVRLIASHLKCDVIEFWCSSCIQLAKLVLFYSILDEI